MLSIRHSIGKTPLLEHMANDSKSVAHFRCYAIAPPTGVYAQVHFTREAYGPILLLCCGAKGYQEPLYLVSNMATAEEACRWYEKRFRIETFFSDQKSRGFHIHKSHMSDVQRLSRLLIAACLAYIWIVYLGSVCEKDQWQ